MNPQKQKDSKIMALLATATIFIIVAIFAEYRESDDPAVLTKAQWERYLELRD
jgi:hypothetical protein